MTCGVAAEMANRDRKGFRCHLPHFNQPFVFDFHKPRFVYSLPKSLAIASTSKSLWKRRKENCAIGKINNETILDYAVFQRCNYGEFPPKASIALPAECHPDFLAIYFALFAETFFLALVSD